MRAALYILTVNLTLKQFLKAEEIGLLCCHTPDSAVAMVGGTGRACPAADFTNFTQLCKCTCVKFCKIDCRTKKKKLPSTLGKIHCAAQHRFPLDCTEAMMVPYLSMNNFVELLVLDGLKRVTRPSLELVKLQHW